MHTLIGIKQIGSSGRSFMVDPLSYFLFQPVFHNWCNKGCGVCYPVCDMVHVKKTLSAVGFILSLSECPFTICPMPYNRK